MMRTPPPEDRSDIDDTDDRAFVDRVAGFEASTGVPHDLILVGIVTALAIALGRLMRWLAGSVRRAGP